MAKVLVVDDSLSVRKVVERALEARSIEVLSVGSGSEALARIQQEPPDLVICDVIMPDKDGYQICQFVKTHPELGKIPVLLISGIVNTAVLERAAEVQSDSVMRKPFAADELMRRIDSLLTNGVNGGVPAPGEGARSRAEAAAVLPPALSALIGSSSAYSSEAKAPAPAPDLKTVLGQFAEAPGVVLVAVVDREGFLVEAVGERRADAEGAWALASWVAEAATGIGRELGQGAIQAVILEYEGGIVLLNAAGPGALLALLLRDPTVLGKVRYGVKRTLPELLRLL